MAEANVCWPSRMEAAPKKCQVVVRKIQFGAGSMHRCVVPVRRLQLQDRHMLKTSCKLRKLSLEHLHKLQVLLQKLKLSEDQYDGVSVTPEKEEKREDGEQMPVQELGALLQKMDPNCSQTEKRIADDHLRSVTGPCEHSLTKRRMRVLLRRLKLTSEIQQRLDHTIFLDKNLGFLTNPYLIPGYYAKRLNRSQHGVLKIGRRSRATRCHVRIRQLQL